MTATLFDIPGREPCDIDPYWACIKGAGHDGDCVAFGRRKEHRE